MQQEKKYFGSPQNAGGDFDNAFFAVEQNNWVNMENCRTLTTAAGEIGTVESIGSTILINNPNLPAGDNIVIGSALDESNNRIAYFVWNSNGDHTIYLFDAIADNIVVVLKNSQVVGGLNFDKNKVIHSTRIVNGCLYWVNDTQNEPRRIDLTAGVEMNIEPSNLPTGYELNTQYLPVTHIDPLNGNFKDASYIVFTFTVPPNPIPSYGSGLISYKLYYQGSNGQPAQFLNITMSWVPPEYPNKTPSAVFIDGVVAPLTALGTPNVDWDVFATATTATIYIKNTWDFGTGDSAFAPIISLNMLVNNIVRTDDISVNPYISPISQSVISWIRRQPGLPPIQTKIYQQSPVITANQVATDAFLFCYRYQYRNFELSTLSGESLLANFNAQTDLFNRIDISIPFGEMIDQ